MEKKYKIADFAQLIGTSAKTVYRMIEREQLTTVIEKVNNRQTTMVVSNDEQIKEFATMNGKYNGNVGNYEDILTVNNEGMTNNNPSQNNNNAEIVNEIMDKILVLNEEFLNRLNKVNEELTNSKAQVLYLEDKAGREGMYLKEINDLKRDNNLLIKSKQTVFNVSLVVIFTLITVIIGMCLFNVMSKPSDNEVIEEMSNNQVTVETPTVERVNKKR